MDVPINHSVLVIRLFSIYQILKNNSLKKNVWLFAITRGAKLGEKNDSVILLPSSIFVVFLFCRIVLKVPNSKPLTTITCQQPDLVSLSSATPTTPYPLHTSFVLTSCDLNLDLSMIMATLDKNSAAMVVDSPTNVSLTVRLIMQGKVRFSFSIYLLLHIHSTYKTLVYAIINLRNLLFTLKCLTK